MQLNYYIQEAKLRDNRSASRYIFQSIPAVMLIRRKFRFQFCFYVHFRLWHLNIHQHFALHTLPYLTQFFLGNLLKLLIEDQFHAEHHKRLRKNLLESMR